MSIVNDPDRMLAISRGAEVAGGKIGTLRIFPVISYQGPIFPVIRVEKNWVNMNLPNGVVLTQSDRDRLKSDYADAMTRIRDEGHLSRYSAAQMRLLREGIEGPRVTVWLPGIVSGVLVFGLWGFAIFAFLRARRLLFGSEECSM